MNQADFQKTAADIREICFRIEKLTRETGDEVEDLGDMPASVHKLNIFKETGREYCRNLRELSNELGTAIVRLNAVCQ